MDHTPTCIFAVLSKVTLKFKFVWVKKVLWQNLASHKTWHSRYVSLSFRQRQAEGCSPRKQKQRWRNASHSISEMLPSGWVARNKRWIWICRIVACSDVSIWPWSRRTHIPRSTNTNTGILTTFRSAVIHPPVVRPSTGVAMATGQHPLSRGVSASRGSAEPFWQRRRRRPAGARADGGRPQRHTAMSFKIHVFLANGVIELWCRVRRESAEYKDFPECAP